MPLTHGQLQLQLVPAGLFHMDGGAMFGVVPKPLWSRKIQPDGLNRIPLATNCLLIRTPDAAILVDTGYGSNLSPREREHYALEEEGHGALTHLIETGIRPEDITHVILTHLHFDHAGGCTLADDSGTLHPVFPRARHIIQRAEWEDAAGRKPELRGAYFERDFIPLHEAGLVDLIEGDAEILPGVCVRLAAGHTRGHQLVFLESDDQRALCVSDLCPTMSHLKTFWTMGYDQNLMEVRRNKPLWLGRAADEGWLVISYHDPHTHAAYLRRDPREEFVIDRAVTL